MKNFLKYIAVIFIFLFLAVIISCKTQNNGKEKNMDWEKFKIRENLTTQDLVEEMKMGINLGNALEATDSEDNRWINPGSIENYVKAWGSPVPTKQMIEGYAEAGFSSLRIPVTWINMMNPDGYVINSDLMDLAENVVNWTIDSGMAAVINTHHDSDWLKKLPVDYDRVKERFTAVWTQVCARFEEYGDRLIFESMNEVGYDEIWVPWGEKNTMVNRKKAFDYVNELNQIFVDIVRSSGGNNTKRHLLINVYNTGLEYAYDPFFKMPDDPAARMAASVHYYTPAVFAILEEDADWGKARSTWGTPADLLELNNNMDLLKRNCVDRGIPVIIGEFAACGSNKTQEMKRLYAVSVAEAVYSRKMCPMLWDTSGDQYDRESGSFRDQVFIDQLMEIQAKYSR